jgi:tetratricopeptide (TPR) repeat protein
MIKKFLIISIVFLASFFSGNAQWTILRTDADSLVRQGSHYIYNVQFDSASVCFNEVKRLYPWHPAGYFLDAMVDWWKISLFRETKEFDDGFVEKSERVIEICDSLLEHNPHDINALFFKGGAHGYLGRFHAKRKNWFSAASEGKVGFDMLIECWKLAPSNSDIQLGTGIYNYFADALPEKYPLVKPLMTFLPPGDKKRGLRQLELSAQNARYAAVEAKVTLLHVYHDFEHNNKKALEISEELHETYPQNPYFHRYLGRAYVRTGNRQMWEKTWREIIKRCIAKQDGYDRVTAREGLYYVGLSLKIKKDFKLALKYFYKCDEACRYLDTDEPSNWMIQTNLFIGQIYDMQDKREEAIEQYEKLLDMPDKNSSHKTAERYIEKPYGK